MNRLAPEAVISVLTADGATELEAHIQCRLGGRIRDFRLVIEKEGVILRGVTHTYYAKQLAQHAFLKLSGLPLLANEIKVS
jgi:hypothetical protein